MLPTDHELVFRSGIGSYKAQFLEAVNKVPALTPPPPAHV